MVRRRFAVGGRRHPARACARARGHIPFPHAPPRRTRQATPMRSPLSLHNENVAPTESPMGV
eukprot:scaffold62419_cov57-Phaeocystis_antarctica.AAC.1